MDDQQPQRLRQRPDERFAGPQHRFDLEAVAARLRQEGGTARSGHQQESLYKHGPTSLSFFIFAAQSRLAAHRTNGTVIIQVLKGRLTVTAEGAANDLGPGGILVMAAGVQHDVVAEQETEMLLTIHLNNA